MSLYNAMFGLNPNAGIALVLARVRPHDVPRFRDAWVQPHPETGEPEILIYTRMGGGNAECWEDNGSDCICPGHIVTDVIPEWDRFLRMEDDDYDSTYRSIYFAPFPDETDVARAVMEPEPVDVKARWDDLMDRIDRGEMTEAEEAASRQIADSIKEALEGEGGGVVQI